LGILSAHHQEFSTVNSALVSSTQVLMTVSKQRQDDFHSDSAWKCFGHPLCPSSGVLYCKFGIGKFHAGFDDRFQAEAG